MSYDLEKARQALADTPDPHLYHESAGLHAAALVEALRWALERIEHLERERNPLNSLTDSLRSGELLDHSLDREERHLERIEELERERDEATAAMLKAEARCSRMRAEVTKARDKARAETERWERCERAALLAVVRLDEELAEARAEVTKARRGAR